MKRKFSETNENPKSQHLIIQREDFYPYHCGVISVYNLLTRLEIQTNLKTVFDLGLQIKKRGMSCDELNYLIDQINKFYNLDIQEQECSVDIIDSILSNNSCGILFFCEDTKVLYGHYAFIEKYRSKTFRIINYSFDTDIKILTKTQLEKLIKPKPNFECPGFWSCSKV